MKAWGIAASPGMEAQVKALAEALGVEAQMKNMQLMPCFAWLPNVVFANPLGRFLVPYMLTKDSDKLEGPWPEMVISCGRRPAVVALGVKHRAGNAATKYIHIQDPQMNPAHFDIVVAMEHDKIEAPNVIKTRYALHSITPEKLSAAARKFESRFTAFAKPYNAVLLGGSTNKYEFTHAAMQDVLTRLRVMLDGASGSLLITTSHRTGAENTRLLKETFKGNSRVYIYDGEGENPYLGLLALAQSIVVSNDSVNMMSEAAATGKPLYILPLSGHGNTKPSRFAERLMQGGIARLWGGQWERWEYDTGSEMKTLAAQIKDRLQR